jgi:hypothetical protein
MAGPSLTHQLTESRDVRILGVLGVELMAKTTSVPWAMPVE